MKTGYREAVDTAKRLGFDFAQIDLGVPVFFLDEWDTPALEAKERLLALIDRGE